MFQQKVYTLTDVESHDIDSNIGMLKVFSSNLDVH